MPAPDLVISAEPADGDDLMFLPLAAKTANDQGKALIAVRLAIRNNSAATVSTTSLTIAFPGCASRLPNTVPMALTIAPDAVAVWVFDTSNTLVVPSPGPRQISFSVNCQGFSQPVVKTMSLVPAGAPVPGGFDFPASASDLRIGEYWSGQSLTHDGGDNGSHLFAYDLVVVGLVPPANALTELLPGTSGTANTDFRVWGKPIRAVANGVVLEVENNVPNNKAPLPDPTEADFAAQAAVWNKPEFKCPGAGNHVYLRHGDHVVLYAHMRHGSLNPALLTPGAAVKRGDVLGLAGNSGNCSTPQLHVHAIHGTAPEAGPMRPFPFRDTWVMESSKLQPPNPSGPWVKAADQGLPAVSTLIWPAATKPAWYPPGWGEITRWGVANADFQTEFNKVTGSGYRMVWVDGFDVAGATNFNMIFRPEDGTPWEATVGLNAADYQAEFNKMNAAGFRPLHVETFLTAGIVQYAGIWVKAAGPAWEAYHGQTSSQHRAQLSSLTKQGFVPTAVSSVGTPNGPLFTALYERRDAGGFFLSELLSFEDYQTQTDANIAAGRHPASLHAVSNGGNPLMLGLWEDKASASTVARHGQTTAQYQAENAARLAEGYLTRAVSGCDDGSGNALYAAIWSK